MYLPFNNNEAHSGAPKQPTNPQKGIKVHKFKIVVQPIGGYFLNYMIYTA